MKVALDCLACAINQGRNAVTHSTDDTALQERILRMVAETYAGKPLEGTPADYSQDAYAITARATGVDDPFAAEKQRFNTLALAMLPECYAALKAAADPLETGAHLAVAGNIIDLGIAQNLDIHGTLLRALETPFAINDLGRLRAALAAAKLLLYIGDNAGEIVFDRVFIETIQKMYPALRVVFSVKSGPIINDATRADAQAVGMDKVCTVVETGNAQIGAPLAQVSAAFRQLFDTADVIISKGQGNFETLNTATQRPLYFILKAKCNLVAKELGVQFGDSVLKHV
jgi:uncharacterized protein with ATP-grasp and redox domains